MRITRTLGLAIAAAGVIAVGSGSALGAYVGGPPPVLTGSLNSSVIVCHGKNLGGTGTVVYHESGAVTGKPGATCECAPE